MTDVLFAGRAPRLWLRLEQHGDKPFYSRMPRDVIDGFVLNANLIESAPEACAAFLDELGKPFVVDPMSYRLERASWYSRDRDGQSVGKRNYVRLWGAYTAGIAGFTGDPLKDSASSKVEGEALVRLCQNALEFQELRLSRAWVEDGAQYAVSQPMFGPELTDQLSRAGHYVRRSRLFHPRAIAAGRSPPWHGRGGEGRQRPASAAPALRTLRPERLHVWLHRGSRSRR